MPEHIDISELVHSLYEEQRTNRPGPCSKNLLQVAADHIEEQGRKIIAVQSGDKGYNWQPQLLRDFETYSRRVTYETDWLIGGGMNAYGQSIWDNIAEGEDAQIYIVTYDSDIFNRDRSKPITVRFLTTNDRKQAIDRVLREVDKLCTMDE